jgi:predicted restriction endonuclease
MDKMREMLLQETNYRCGYCMRNITPRRYQFLGKADDDYRLLNVFDRAHLIPHRITQDNYKDFYNLIALCKICHHEVDKSGILGNKECESES